MKHGLIFLIRENPRQSVAQSDRRNFSRFTRRRLLSDPPLA